MLVVDYIVQGVALGCLQHVVNIRMFTTNVVNIRMFTTNVVNIRMFTRLDSCKH